MCHIFVPEYGVATQRLLSAGIQLRPRRDERSLENKATGLKTQHSNPFIRKNSFKKANTHQQRCDLEC